MTLALLLLTLQDPLAVRAESLLARHELAAARSLAEDLARRHPEDPALHILLGRVWLEWPTFGRYNALGEFRRAARLAPRDPEPLYWVARAGLRLGDDEGEVIVREAALRMLALDPGYRDAWELFTSVYHDADIWERADAALAAHPDAPDVPLRRAGIALALDQPERADSFARLALAGRGPYIPGLLLEAEAAFDAGRDSAGYAWYDSVLVHADLDTTGAIWDQVWMIASPEETARHDTTAPADQPRFYQWFWDKRDPDLVTPVNERIAEHFRRLAFVRRTFHILHPYSFYHRSPTWRAIVDSHGQEWLSRALAADPLQLNRALETNPLIVPAASADRALLAGLGPPRQTVGDTVGSETIYLKSRLDARGILWIRHGRPDVWAGGIIDPSRPVQVASPLDAAGWEYDTPDGILSVGLFNLPGGGMVLFPVSSRQFQNARVLLATDNTSIPAPLEARGWTAFFKDHDPGLTDVYYRAAPDTAAVALLDSSDERVARARGPGLIELIVPPGRYQQGFDVDSSGVLGRSRGEVTVPAYSRVQLGLSSLLLTAQDSVTERRPMLAAMPADLVYPPGRTLAAYAEIYGLARDRDGIARYTAQYTFAPERGPIARILGRSQPVIFEFNRSQPADAVTPERLVIEPGRLPPGRYRVTLAVTDILRNVKSETVAISVTVE
ncbi:MAG TPA: GWxTD domain-containing protein [Gemmatimonadales bacterium]|nr:GWxTD domain-containing protein [Gemmatimonadales bacterium]